MTICYVDIIDSCHLKCPTCVRGTRLLPNTATRLSVPRFTEIARKALSEGYDSIGLYNWTEPFLNAKLAEYVRIIKSLELRCEISTTLSFTGRNALIRDALAAGVDTLIVSVSGATQEIHGINHKGGNLEHVKRNLEYVAALERAGDVRTRVTLRFLRFAYNAGQEAPLAAYAASLGLGFEALTGVGDPRHPVTEYADEEHFLDKLKHFSAERRRDKTGEVCPLVMDTVSVDAAGKVFICCAYPNYAFLEIGPYLEMSREEILFKRYTHPICASCSFPRRQAGEQDIAALGAALRGYLGWHETTGAVAEAPADQVETAAPPPVTCRD